MYLIKIVWTAQVDNCGKLKPAHFYLPHAVTEFQKFEVHVIRDQAYTSHGAYDLSLVYARVAQENNTGRDVFLTWIRRHQECFQFNRRLYHSDDHHSTYSNGCTDTSDRSWRFEPATTGKTSCRQFHSPSVSVLHIRRTGRLLFCLCMFGGGM